MRNAPMMYLTINIPVDWRNILKDNARKEDVSISEIVRRAIDEKYIRNHQPKK